MKYTILRTELADEQLNDIIDYIAEEFGYDSAFDYIDRIEETMESLGSNPELGVVPRFRALKKFGYRVLIVGLTLVFYKKDDNRKEIIIHAIVDSRRDYINLVK